MIWTTADTNILVSGLNFRGNPNKFLDLARSGSVRLAVSDAILDEMTEVLAREFDWPKEDIAEVRRQLVRYGHKVTPTETLDVVKADPDDNAILECAVAAHSDYVVSGDKHLLSLGSFRDMPIVKVAEFLNIVGGHGKARGR